MSIKTGAHTKIKEVEEMRWVDDIKRHEVLTWKRTLQNRQRWKTPTFGTLE